LTGQADDAAERPVHSGRSELPEVPAATAFGLPAIWLRDNCGCARCRDPASGERLTSVGDLAAGVSILAMHRTGDRIEIEFSPDRHRVVYDARWLDQFRPAAESAGAGDGAGASADSQDRGDSGNRGDGAAGTARAAAAAGAEDGRSEDAKQLWGAAEIAGAFPWGSWPLYQASAAHQQGCLRAVLRDGFVVLTGMPREPAAVLGVAQSTGLVRETERGRVIDVKVSASPSSQAFTSAPLAPCTAAPFRDPLLTVKVLGCLNDAAEGGDTTLVDGFCAAARLRAERPAAFAVLAATAVTFAHADARADLRATRPVIGVDPRGRIREIRFASSYLAPLRLPTCEIVAFYDAYRSFAQLLASPDQTLTFRLRPGDCLILDNTRILNGRTGFTGAGQRHLQACWTDLDGLASRLAILERRQHNGASQH
jgi:gamma-butyrobetaine dioxygenase